MATIGNLELRIGTETLYGSTTHDGENVYKVVERLAGFLNATASPTTDQYRQWFRTTARELLPFRHRQDLTGGCSREVIIDVPRRLIVYSGDLADFVLDSKFVLEQSHHYQFLQFVQPLLRQ